MSPESAKHFEFTGTPGSFFVNYVVVTLLSMIPLVGFAFGFNYQNGWLAKNVKIDGRNLAYKAGFGEVWVMLFVGILLTVITLGIYTFWFVPKVYRFILGHTSFADEMPAASAAPVETPATPAAPAVNDVTPPTPPATPTNLVQ